LHVGGLAERLPRALEHRGREHEVAALEVHERLRVATEAVGLAIVAAELDRAAEQALGGRGLDAVELGGLRERGREPGLGLGEERVCLVGPPERVAAEGRAAEDSETERDEETAAFHAPFGVARTSGSSQLFGGPFFGDAVRVRVSGCSSCAASAARTRMRAGALAALLVACGGEAGAGPLDASTDAHNTADAGAIDGGSSALDAGRADDAGRPDAAPDAGRLGPPYPIVLAHGFFGFEDFAGAGFLSYFYGVREDLAERGETLVFTPAVDPFNDSETRGATLTEAVEAIVEHTGYEKVVLIGHSQGGLDARVVADARPDLVAAIVTVATPHGGTSVADIALGLVRDDRAAGLVDAIVRLIGAPLWDASGEETSVVRALEQLSTEGMAAFNARHPAPGRIPIWSIGGRSDRHGGGDACRGGDPMLERWERDTDPIDPLLSITEAVLDGGLFDPDPNDGLVRVDDSKFGIFLGCIPADHLDEIGQVAGDGPGLFNDFDHREFYAALVEWVRARGY
jgi:triacylglycerol lipase